MQCPRCGEPNAERARFCQGCGAALVDVSSSPAGYTPRHLAEKILTSRTALEGERKQVTVLFCDLAGSTGLAERHGPEGMHRLLERFFELALGAVHRYEGTINQFLGDGFMALFGAPLVHEDDARRAVLAALELRDALRNDAEMQVRMGLNTGPVVVGKIGDNLRMDYTAVGDTTNLAARLQQLAQPGEIYAGESTYRLTRAFVEYESLGQRAVKGKSEMVALYRVVAAGAQRSAERQHLRSPIVGRDAELDVLLGAVERVSAGEGGIVGVIGEAGLGKSRLVAEVRSRTAGSDITWLEGRALSFSQGLSYWPFLEIVRQWAGITEADGETESWTKLERELHVLFADEAIEVLPYVATWLGLAVPKELDVRVRYLDGEALGRQIFRAARRFFERLAQVRPLVLVFEDLHWSDQSSTELIEHLFPLVEETRLLLIGAGRPERDNPAARLRGSARQRHGARYWEIALAPLASGAAHRLVANLLTASAAPADVAALVLARAEGNPFFIEEVLRTLIDTGALVREDARGAWRTALSIDEVSVPDTLEAVILARVDRLEDEAKQVLRVAAVIGRSFLYRILRALAQAERRLDDDLEQLLELELIREKHRLPELEYFFKHALVQEATYGSILAERRRSLHREVAQCMERLFAERLDEFAGVLAHHFARAEAWDKAQHYLFLAGDQAGRIAADSEALAHYRHALSAFERVATGTDLQRALLERKMGEALFRRGQHNEALDYLERALRLLGEHLPKTKLEFALAFARELLQQAIHRLRGGFAGKRPESADQEAEERFRCFDALIWMVYFIDPRLWLYATLRLLNEAERRGQAIAIASGSFSIGMALDLVPLFKLGAAYHGRAMAMAKQSRHPLALGYAHIGTALHEEAVGHMDSALSHYRRGADHFTAVGHVRGWGLCAGKIACTLRNQGDFAGARKLIAEIRRTAEDASDRDTLAYSLTYEAQVAWFTGPFESAVAVLDTAIDLFKTAGNQGGAVMAQGTLVRIYVRVGDLQRAATVSKETDRIIESRGLRGTLTMWQRLADAECRLAQVDETPSALRGQALAQARTASKRAVAFARTFSVALPAALRAHGRYYWRAKQHAEARRCWARSLEAAARLGATPELGFTHREMGEALGEPEHLQQAEEIFSRIGASHDLACIRDAMREPRRPSAPPAAARAA